MNRLLGAAGTLFAGIGFALILAGVGIIAGVGLLISGTVMVCTAATIGRLDELIRLLRRH